MALELPEDQPVAFSAQTSEGLSEMWAVLRESFAGGFVDIGEELGADEEEDEEEARALQQREGVEGGEDEEFFATEESEEVGDTAAPWQSRE